VTNPTPRNTSAGGVLIAIGAIGGAAIGLLHGQPTIALLIGLGLGIVAAIAIWLRDRQR
jgi:hypothetical protein